MLRILLCLAVALSVAVGTAYAKGAKKNLAAKAKKTVEERYADMDTNKDGKVSLDEFKAKFPKPEVAEKAFKAMDADNDGSVTVEEFKAHMEKHAKGGGKKKKSEGQ